MAVKLFFCYAHEDEPLLNKLKSHLSPLRRQGLIELWHDRDISAGTEWEEEIKDQLNTAQIILLLISPDFMDSDYCYSIEMKRALERHELKEAQVIPIILRPVYWKGAPFGKLQALPTDAKPISTWRNKDNAYFSIIEGISKIIETISATDPPAYSTRRNIKLFVLGRPGSGKATAIKIIESVAKISGYRTKTFQDYDILRQMSMDDTEGKFRSARLGGSFDIIDLSALDTTLEILEKQVQDYISNASRELITIVFSRNDYKAALSHFSPSFVKNADFLFIDADLSVCRDRIYKRAASDSSMYNYFVSDQILHQYYEGEQWKYMAYSLKEDFGIHRSVMAIANNRSYDEFHQRVVSFAELILRLEDLIDDDVVIHPA